MSKSEYVKKWRETVYRPLILVAKAKPCKDCDVQYPVYVMQFDYRPGEKKEFEISRALSSPVSMVRLLAEILKCDVVCANCHAVRTWTRANTGK